MAKNYTTLRRLIFLFAIISILGKLTLTDWGSWAAIIAGAVAIVMFVIFITKSVINKVKTRHLFEAHFEQKDDELLDDLTIEIPPKEFILHLTLIMKVATNINKVEIEFKGTGQIPERKSISDRVHPYGTNSDIITIRERNSIGTGWEETGWRQLQHQHRDEGDQVTIDIRCQSISAFDGNLEITLHCGRNLKRNILLPFRIKEGNDTKATN